MSFPIIFLYLYIHIVIVKTTLQLFCSITHIVYKPSNHNYSQGDDGAMTTYSLSLTFAGLEYSAYMLELLGIDLGHVSVVHVSNLTTLLTSQAFGPIFFFYIILLENITIPQDIYRFIYYTTIIRFRNNCFNKLCCMFSLCCIFFLFM